MSTKRCTRCGEEKPLSEFYIRRDHASDGYSSHCKKCTGDRTTKYRALHIERYRELSRISATKSSRRLRDLVIASYGGRCACCGEAERKFLSLDHVNGGGCKHIAAHGSNAPYRDARDRNFPPDYQVLCFNCNCAKGFYGQCPHKAQKDPSLNPME